MNWFSARFLACDKMSKNTSKMISKTKLGNLITKIVTKGFEKEEFTQSLIIKGDEDDILEFINDILLDWNDTNTIHKVEVETYDDVEGADENVRRYEFTLSIEMDDPDFEVDSAYKDDEDFCEVITPAKK